MKKRCFLFVVLGLLAVSCKSKQGDDSVGSPEYNPYVTAFTSGNISVKSGITVQLCEDSPRDPDSEIKDKLFDISPPVNGKIHMSDKRTFVFMPDENLKSNQKYTVTFNVGKAIEKADRKHAKFVFGFSTIKPSFYMIREGLKLYSETSPHIYKLVREVHLSDYADADAVKKILTVKFDNKAQSVKWEHEGNIHTFTVDSISALDTPSEMLLSLDAKPIGGDIRDEEKIRVPSKLEFDVLSIGMSEEEKEQVIICRFSAPIDSKQNLKGIVSLENARFTYRIVLNTIMIYPSEKLTGNVTLTIHESLKSANGGSFGKNHTEELIFESVNPEVKFINRGNILPSSNEGTTLPFQAVSLKSVTVKIIKVYENNILQFFQVNNMAGNTELKRAGRLIAVKTIRLDENKTEKELKRWNTYALELSKLVVAEQGAIYRIELSFGRSQAIADCDNGETDLKEYTDEELFASLEKGYDNASSYYYDDYNDYYYEDYSYENSQNPCHNSYYANKSVARNVLASDLGIIAKMGTNSSARFIVTNIHSVLPIASVNIELYNYQQQLIGSGTTGAEGFADINVTGQPYFAIAKYGNQRGYLQMQDGTSLSLSRFDVAGDAVKNGVKGYIYGERGVWRPGDSIYLTFILQDNTGNIPAAHPAIMEITSATGQIVSRQSKIGGKNGFYTFVYKTDDDAPTGNWHATVKIGGISFHKTLKVETVKPNRLKINLNFDKKEIDLNEPVTGTLSATWLHGAQVKNLNTEVTMYLNSSTTSFKGFEPYIFDDPTKTFEATEKTFFSGKLDNEGSVSFSEKLTLESTTSGKLKANFVTRVFEESGDFSVETQSREISPYKRYVGILQPKGTGFGNMLETDKNQTFSIVLLDKSGKQVDGNTELNVSVYKLGWSWWWSSSNDQLANFNYSSYKTPVHEEKINISGGRGIFSYKTANSGYGFYLVRVEDKAQSPHGHSAGTVAYFDWPGWGGRARQGAESVTMLMFESDKESYSAGESAVIKFPSTNMAKALVSIENGTKVLHSYWVNCTDGETKIEIKTTREMTPNVYVSVSLVQPHSQTQNDMPIRLFGVIPIKVVDPGTKLQPVINMPNAIRPEEKYKVTVSEAGDSPMTYTLAVVDEGLLDLTRFKTPNPWDHFYAKEALGVNTWDIYEHLIGAYGGHIEQLYAVGGDGYALASRAKVNRFKSVVHFSGPFVLDKGKKMTHELEMQSYIGSVRVMVVAGNKISYGFAEKTVPVKKPLMTLATLPRVLSPGEEISLPVTVFSTDESIRKADISIEANELFEVEETKHSLSFASTGEEMTAFKVRVKNRTGAGKVKIIAVSGNERSEYSTEIEVRPPNPPISNVKSLVLEAGKKESFADDLPGMDGTNTARIEASFIPPLNLGERLEYLIQYPHGCIEQTTSAAFPQLYLNSVIEMSEKEKSAASYNVKAALNRLRDFVYDGGFGYWPHDNSCDLWGTNYAGDFMLEAEKRGFSLPSGMKQNWIKFQQKRAREWTQAAQKRVQYSLNQNDLVQAYRLYTLAKANAPELGAMNRLKEEKNVTAQTRWVLAAAYALAGQPEIAKNMIENISTNVKEYSTSFSETYGSSTRDIAMILDALIIIGNETQVFELVKSLSQNLNSKTWLSTQSTAYALMGISRYAEKQKSDKSITIEYVNGNNAKQKASTAKSVWTANLGKISSGKFEVENLSQNSLYIQLTTTGTPLAGAEVEHENKIRISVKYLADNVVINPEKIRQGTDFKAIVSITNLSASNETYSNLALTQIFPSGWEIINERLFGIETQGNNGYDYCDVRDDRICTYFSLGGGTQKTFTVKLNAAYIGKFYLPAFKVEAMYDGSVSANNSGKWIEVCKDL